MESLITRAQAMRQWLLTAADCSCTTLDVCALFEPGGEKAPAVEPEPFRITRVGGALQRA